MAAEALQALHGRQRRLEALDGLERADPAEIAGSGGRQQQKPDIGRRCPMGDDRVADPPGSCPAAACCRPAVTNVSKKRQVRRAISRSDLASDAEIARLPASAGATLTQRAIAGANSQARMKGAATGMRRAAGIPDEQRGQRRDEEASRHLADEAHPVGAQHAAWTGPRWSSRADGGG